MLQFIKSIPWLRDLIAVGSWKVPADIECAVAVSLKTGTVLMSINVVGSPIKHLGIPVPPTAGVPLARVHAALDEIAATVRAEHAWHSAERTLGCLCPLCTSLAAEGERFEVAVKAASAGDGAK